MPPFVPVLKKPGHLDCQGQHNMPPEIFTLWYTPSKHEIALMARDSSLQSTVEYPGLSLSNRLLSLQTKLDKIIKIFHVNGYPK